MIGSREVVGYGCNGSYDYFDRMDLPYPAIRFKEVKGDLVDIKEKEKGDWKNLTVDEKKACQYLMSQNVLHCSNQLLSLPPLEQCTGPVFVEPSLS